jgi:hypothetical protein
LDGYRQSCRRPTNAAGSAASVLEIETDRRDATIHHRRVSKEPGLASAAAHKAIADQQIMDARSPGIIHATQSLLRIAVS